MDGAVFITGVSSGIGRALALRYATLGRPVVGIARNRQQLAELEQEFKRLSAAGLFLVGDVKELSSLEQAVRASLERFGRIETVIANAGFGVYAPFNELGVEDYQRQFDTNVWGVLNTAKATFEALKVSRGSFGVIGSIAGMLWFPNASAYSMSKACVRSFALTLRAEWSQLGISVTHIAPGFVASNIRRVNNQGELIPKAKDPIPEWLILPTDKAAKQIQAAIDKRKAETFITGHAKFLAWLVRHMPRTFRALVSLAKVRGRSEPKTQRL